MVDTKRFRKGIWSSIGVLLLVVISIFHCSAQGDKNKLNSLAKKIEDIAISSPDSLAYYAKQGITLAQKEKQIHLVVRFQHLLARQAFIQANYKEAVRLYLDAIRIGEKQAVSPEYIHVLYDASEVYRKIDKDSSMSLVRKGLYNAEKINHKDLIADGYNRLGYAFEIRSANDSALVYYQKGLKINQIVNNKLGTSYALESIAGILNKQKRYNDALRYLRQSLALRVGLKDKFAQSISLINLGETYRSLKNTDSAIFYGKAASAMAQEVQFLDLAGYSNTFLSDIYKDQKDFKNALQYKERGVALKDSAFNIEKAKQIAELDRKYQTEKRIQQINILNQQATIDAMTVRQRNLMLVALIVLILVSGIVLYNIFAKRKLKAKAELQAEIIKQQDIAAKAVLDAEERERRRIAGDLHDGVGQMLSVALLNLNGVFSKIDLSETERAQADKTLGLLNESYDEMRSISHQMMPNALIKSGLATAVKEFLNKINKDRIKVSLQTVGLNKRLEDQLETVIYRVIQESVNNVIKHAEATSLDIQIVRDEEGLDVTIEDNGKGFDKDKLKKSDGIGMANIFTRIAFLKGTVEIDSAPGRGTLIAIHIPAN